MPERRLPYHTTAGRPPNPAMGLAEGSSGRGRLTTGVGEVVHPQALLGERVLPCRGRLPRPCLRPHLLLLGRHRVLLHRRRCVPRRRFAVPAGAKPISGRLPSGRSICLHARAGAPDPGDGAGDHLVGSALGPGGLVLPAVHPQPALHAPGMRMDGRADV